MKLCLLLMLACSIGFAGKAQDCADLSIQGYKGDSTVTIEEARRVILTSFAAINSCNEKLKLRSGSLYWYNNGDIFDVENFTSPLDNETKLRLIGKLKPGLKLVLADMHYGEENKPAPKLALTLKKGPIYLGSSK